MTVFTDSQLLARQINGQYRVRSESLKHLYDRAVALIESFECVSVRHVAREQNREADRLARKASKPG